MRTHVPTRLFLPSIIFVSVLIVGLRVNDIWKAATQGLLFAPVQAVQAEEKKGEAPKETKAVASDAPSAPARPPDDSSPESALYKQLAGRREQLDARARSLDAREAVIKITEQRVEQKLAEMKVLREQLETLLGQANGAQAAQIENLVKIYETMKPKEAARIFETLEMPILMGVVQRMKPARTAAVMAEMDPLKAKEITVALTKQDQLPQVK